MSIKIYVDQGHNPNSFNTGAEGNGFYEQDITYDIGTRFAALLRQNPNFEVRVSRSSADEVLGTSNSSSLSTRVREANSWGGLMCLFPYTQMPPQILTPRAVRH